jgi:hypothetical protein
VLGLLIWFRRRRFEWLVWIAGVCFWCQDMETGRVGMVCGGTAEWGSGGWSGMVMVWHCIASHGLRTLLDEYFSNTRNGT